MAGGTVAGAVTLAANTTIETTKDSTFSAVIDGSGRSVTLTGDNTTLTLSGANTYTGGTTISAGTVKTTNASALGTGNVTVASTGTLLVSQNLTIKGDGTATNNGLDNQGTVSIADGKTLSLYGQVSNKQYNLGTVNVLGSTATIENTNHRGTISLGAITGTAGSTVTLFSNHSSDPATWNLGTAASGSFSAGELVLQAGDSGTTATARAVYFNFNNAGMFSGATVKLQNAAIGSATKTMNNNVVLNAATVKVGGISDAAEGTVADNRIWSISKGSAAGNRATLELDGNDANGYSTAVKVGADIDIKKTGSATQVFSGNMTQFNGSIDVEAGTLNVMNIAASTSLNVKDVTIASGATLGVYNGATATADTDHEGTLTMKSGSHLKAGGDNATLNANLVMESGSTLEVSLAQATHGLTMGCSLSLNTGDLLGTDDLGFVQNLQFGQYYYLYNGVDSLTVNSTQYEALNFEDYKHFDMDASKVYTQLDEKRYALVYSWNGDNVGRVAITLLPEPTTSTLSLLALCALAARRRRRS
ncbi:MAG: autotransporter-associated beta strand repeat-containing protein [Akkermansia sp.]|nr:autotransporter-associated beta strand repeat-containing protein [Akkermansia sp.]